MRAALSHLKNRADFLRIAAGKRKYAAPGLVLQVASQPPGIEAGVRVGYTASRKVGGAVVRNRAKRRLRAAARELLVEHALPGHDYVLIARPSTAEAPWPTLLADLETALRRVKAWSDAQGAAP
jgi:ribonuclease P protein component